MEFFSAEKSKLTCTLSGHIPCRTQAPAVVRPVNAATLKEQVRMSHRTLNHCAHALFILRIGKNESQDT